MHLEEVRRLIRLVEESEGLKLIEGRFVLELSIAGVDNGKALQRVRQELHFTADPVVAIGDDSADEDAFDVLGEGDLSIHVGSGPTAARFVLRRPGDMKRLLSELVAARTD